MKKQKLVTMIMATFWLTATFSATWAPSVEAKEHKTYGSAIDIDASPEVVFAAIQKQRNSTEQHRTLKSYDGKVAVIDEHLTDVPVYGEVDCTWQETEEPYTRIDYKMLKSTKFKEGYGTWTLTPSADGKKTTLEFKSYTDSALMIPFAGELTKMRTIDTSKTRLKHIKEVSEAMLKTGEWKNGDGKKLESK